MKTDDKYKCPNKKFEYHSLLGSMEELGLIYNFLDGKEKFNTDDLKIAIDLRLTKVHKQMSEIEKKYQNSQLN